jgi:hypothetical protein
MVADDSIMKTIKNRSSMEMNKTMKSVIKPLALVGIVAMCLIVMPALSMPTGDSTKTQCNSSDKSNGNAYRPEMRTMWNPAMESHGIGHMGMMEGKNAPWNGTGVMKFSKIGSGFATSGDQYHVLRMNIVGNVTLNPANLKKLVSENKTLGQIKSDMKAELNSELVAGSYKGSLHLSQNSYNLMNVKLTPSKDNSTIFDADVAGPKLNAKDNPNTIVGHITVTASRHENSTIGEGTLTMNSGQYSGQYKVLLQMNHAMGKHNDRHAYAFAGMNHNGEKSGMNKEDGAAKEKIGQKA